MRVHRKNDNFTKKKPTMHLKHFLHLFSIIPPFPLVGLKSRIICLFENRENLAEAVPFLEKAEECERKCSEGASCRYYKYVEGDEAKPR